MPKALLVYPEQPASYWSFDEALEVIGKKSAFPPLGLLTIAGKLPSGYELRLVDMNVAPLTDQDLEWAEIVITSSMIIHWDSLEQVIARCNARGVPVLCGGPLPTQYCDELRGEAVFYRGEAENGFVDLLAPMGALGGLPASGSLSICSKVAHTSWAALGNLWMMCSPMRPTVAAWLEPSGRWSVAAAIL